MTDKQPIYPDCLTNPTHTLRTQAQPVVDEREAFEAHWRNSNGYETLTWDAMCKRQGVPVPEGCEGRYFYREPRLAWEAWQVRAALAAQAPVTDLQNVHDAVTVDLLNERVAYLEAKLKEAQAPQQEVPAVATEAIREAIAEFRLTHWADEDGGLGLADALSQLYGDDGIGRASEELDHLADEIASAMVAPQQAQEPFGYVNTHTGQFFKDVEACRKNNEGHWRTVYTAQPAPSGDALQLERERICAAIKAEDDYCIDQGDYMLDSDDCIKIVRGEWVRPEFAGDAARKEGNKP